jgi:hypothetical protein
VVRPYPVHTLEEAVAIASTIQERNSGLPFDRVLLAKAMGTTPASSAFTIKLNSSAKYGLTQGGYNDDKIVLTPQGGSVVAPQRSGERRQALLQAAMQPELFRRFYEMLDGKKVPEDDFAQNKLGELEVQASLAAECLRIIKANGLYAGVLGEVAGSLYVSLSGAHLPSEVADDVARPTPAPGLAASPVEIAGPPGGERADPGHGGMIFIGHAGAPDVVDFIKTVLDEFDIPYAVVESSYDDRRPVNAEASKVMRECNAAILVFARPSLALVSGGREISGADTMLYQMGAASVLYGERIIRLVENEVEPRTEDAGFQTLQFDRDRLGELALAILAALHHMAVIEVRTGLHPADHARAG